MSPTFEQLANSAQTFVNVDRERLIKATQGRTEPAAKYLLDAATGATKKMVQLRPRTLLPALPFLNPEEQLAPPQEATVATTPATLPVPATGSPTVSVPGQPPPVAPVVPAADTAETAE